MLIQQEHPRCFPRWRHRRRKQRWIIVSREFRPGLRAKCGMAVGEKNSSLCQDGGRNRNRVPPGNKSAGKHRKTWERT